MKKAEQNLHEFLDQSFGRFRELPSNDVVDSACDRVLDRLHAAPDRASERFVVPQAGSARRYGRVVILVTATMAVAVLAQQLTSRFSTQAPLVKTGAPAEQRTPEPGGVADQTPEAQETPKLQPPNSSRRLQFAAASVKPIAPQTLMSAMGLACHGADGSQRVVLTITAAAQGAVRAPQGRCVGNGIFLSTVVELAYGVSPKNIVGGPEWARTTGSLIGGFITLPAMWMNNQVGWYGAESFQIEATADNPSTATLSQLKEMLQSMLADRFKLRFHRERREVPGFSLVVAEKGVKMKPVSGEYEESLVLDKGRSTLDKLARTLQSFLLEEVPIVDKTGLEGAFEYEFPLFPGVARGAGDGAGAPIAAGGGGGRSGGAPPPAEKRAESLSPRLEEQLGLRLQPEKVTVEIFVIDSVELPSAN